eukprot:m.58942 g.58942  ORF g.58942 m.58942 type:complete len:135 (-) comp22628_c0_seq2:1089-1493(-)
MRTQHHTYYHTDILFISLIVIRETPCVQASNKCKRSIVCVAATLSILLVFLKPFAGLFRQSNHGVCKWLLKVDTMQVHIRISSDEDLFLQNIILCVFVRFLPHLSFSFSNFLSGTLYLIHSNLLLVSLKSLVLL